MNQKVLNISLPKERALWQLKKFKFLQHIVEEIESFLKNDENFLLLNIYQRLISDYLIKAALNSEKIDLGLIDLNKEDYFLKNITKPVTFVINLSKDSINEKSEIFLFNLFNDCLESNKKIIFSSSDFINNLNIKLPDLESRLKTVLPCEILNPTDQEKMDLISFEMNQRGLEIKEKELNYIFTYHSRDLDSLLNLANKLDQISYEQKKSISINLIKRII